MEGPVSGVQEPDLSHFVSAGIHPYPMMIPELEALKSCGLSDVLAAKASAFLESGDVSIPRNISSFPADWRSSFVGKALVSELPWNERAANLLRFFTHLSDGASAADDEFHQFLFGALRHLHGADYDGDPVVALQVAGEIEAHHGALDSYVTWHLGQYSYGNNWNLEEGVPPEAPFASPVANLIFRHLSDELVSSPDILTRHDGLFSALAIHRKELTSAWCAKSVHFDTWETVPVWCAIIDASTGFDDQCLSFCETMSGKDADRTFRIVRHLVERRGGKHHEMLLEIAAMPQAALGHEALNILLEHRGEEILPIMTRAFALGDAGDHTSMVEGPAYARLFESMISRWCQGGRELLPNLVANFNKYKLPGLLAEHLPPLSTEHLPALREGFLRRVERTEPRDRVDLWRLVAKSHPQAFFSDFEEMLAGKSKPLREIAAGALVQIHGRDFVAQATEMLGAKKSDARQGAAAFFEQLADPVLIPLLQGALEVEQSNDVRDALHRALQTCGMFTSAAAPESASGSYSDLEISIAKQAAKLKFPATSWFKHDTLPPLCAKDGTSLAPQAIVFLIAKQSKHKTIDAAPDLLPLLSHIDRGKSAPFALALVEGFLNSEQAAADRWALALGGLLGDNRIIPPLLSRIPDWCENSRHKLAEYAAQAISLLPGNEPLMVLDTLANRYRSKFKNVGKACAAAFNAAAAARGITPDELGDLVVPDFGFDAEGIRRFDWDGGGASAELGADFKLSWFDPDTDKAWKALPASAPAAVRDEVKTLGKLLREAVKGQTARLEMALVRQRRWPVARWRELYENHPLLRSFASSLVWAIYDASGSLQRTFRRYPNGLLANAAGDLEELPESDTMIGMVHPLELDAAALDAWRAHLGRFKVKQPFPQIDRPVELLDPLHGNRREISLAKGKQVGAGTFKSRSEKRGWYRGSVIDAGGISSVYKPFPGAGYEAILATDNYWVGIDPMDNVELGAAYFVKADSVERGSYTYDDPAPDDPRVLRFDQVPAVVWSETMADLKAIIGA